MKKLTFLWAVWLIVCLAVLPVHAEEPAATSDPLLQFGLTQEEAAAFDALIAGMEGEVTEADILELVQSLTGADADAAMPGEYADGVYEDPDGYTFKVPQGWTLQERKVGPAVVLLGAIDDTGFAPSITVMSTPETEDDLMKKTKEEIDAVLSGALANYMSITLDEFTFEGNPARELVCMYGADEASMMIQHQLQFVHEGYAYTVTLTTRAEEAAHEEALDTYDRFLADFTVHGGQGNG